MCDILWVVWGLTGWLAGWLDDWLVVLNGLKIPASGIANAHIKWIKFIHSTNSEKHTDTHTHTYHRKVFAYCIAHPHYQMNKVVQNCTVCSQRVHYCMTCVISVCVCVFIKWMRYFASHQHFKLYDYTVWATL